MTYEQIREYTQKCVLKDYYGTNPSMVALSSYYLGNRQSFVITRAIAEKEIQIFKQQLKK